MRKITLSIIIIFIIVIGIIFIGSNYTQQNSIITNNANQTFVDNRSNDINSPNISIKKLNFSSASSSPDSFTMNEMSKHNSKKDCYLIINNNVYDVSSYMSYHPAGSKAITSRCGKEVTGIFAKIHSNRAWDLLKKYKIGTIATNNQNTTSQVLTSISDGLKKQNSGVKIIKVSPKKNFFVAKLIKDGKLYEVHINDNGQIFKEEIEDDESDWSFWEDDNDDE